jgi:hypothetical protein
VLEKVSRMILRTDVTSLPEVWVPSDCDRFVDFKQ